MELGIGTELFISNAGNKGIEKIVRETPTMWITENDRTKIYKKDNLIVGNSSSKWNLKRFVIAKQEHYDMLKRSKLAYELRKFNYDNLKLDQLEKIQEIIKRGNNGK